MSGTGGSLYIWLEGEPDLSPPDFEIDDVPGERDLDLIAAAVVEGRFGAILPVRIHYGERHEPRAGQWKSIDTARFLRDYSIRHRRRYEVMLDAIPDQFNASDDS
ncbi:MAG: hypothetical protein R3A46_06530 [Thermomicrobiales bacterium]